MYLSVDRATSLAVCCPLCPFQDCAAASIIKFVQLASEQQTFGLSSTEYRHAVDQVNMTTKKMSQEAERVIRANARAKQLQEEKEQQEQEALARQCKEEAVREYKRIMRLHADAACKSPEYIE